MPKLIVAFKDGAVQEYYSGDNKGLYSHLRRLKNVFGWEIVPDVNVFKQKFLKDCGV